MHSFYRLYLFISVLVIVYIFYKVKYQKKNIFSKRAEKDGGSILFTKSFMDYGLWLIEPIANLFITLHLRPNHITFLSMLIAFLAILPIAQGDFHLAGFLVGLSSLLDAMDGMMSRKLKMNSSAGSILDSVADRVSEFFICFGLIYFYRDHFFGLIGVFSTLMGSVLVSYTSAKGEIFKLKDLPRGFMRRGERALFLTLGFLFSAPYAHYFKNTTPHYNFMIVILWAIGILSISSSVFRVRWLYTALKNE